MSANSSSSRYTNQVSISLLVWMVLLAAITAAGGVTYATLKYNQVIERTAIAKIDREIALCRMTTNQYRAKADAMANYSAILARLESDHSALTDIRYDQIEIARSTQEDQRLRSTAAR